MKRARDSVSAISARWPGREEQCKQLCQLLEDPELCLPLLVHGPSGGGKTAVLHDVLQHFQIPAAYIDCISNPTDRGLYTATLNQLAQHTPCAANHYTNWSQCDTPAGFIAGLRQLATARGGRVCLVLDKAERLAQRMTLLQILLSLPTLCAGSAAVNIVLVAETPFPTNDVQLWEIATELHLLRVYFPGYTQPQLSTVLKRDARNVAARLGSANGLALDVRHKALTVNNTGQTYNSRGATCEPKGTRPTDNGQSCAPTSASALVNAPEAECNAAATPTTSYASTQEFTTAFDTFVGTFVDFFSAVCRDTHELRHLVRELFPKYVLPALHGAVDISDTRKLMQEALPLLRRSLRRVYARDGETGGLEGDEPRTSSAIAALEMPGCSKYLLLAGYLASHFPVAMDAKLFSSTKRTSGARRGRRPAAADESHSFTVERLLAIFDSLQSEASSTRPLRAELLVQLASLCRMQLLLRTSNEELLDGIRLRCNVPFEVVEVVARSIKFDLRQYQEVS
ncbi:hypothetical protein AB1Y20_017558 [Prymnesium parvum]|uniref:Origin recognition complex subunit 5 n=1 Tax=Prymnesium parvum TaxID=97485 RepID=A0AB34JLL5_PRYPA